VVAVVYIGDWKPYQAELQEVFGFHRPPDPDPSEWFSTEDFLTYRPVLEALKTVTQAKAQLEGPYSRRVAKGRDWTDDRVAVDHEQASATLRAAEEDLRRLDADPALGGIRLRVEKKLDDLRRRSGDPSN
jgi:hypothetical protein